jgi:hypothetical protein
VVLNHCNPKAMREVCRHTSEFDPPRSSDRGLDDSLTHTRLWDLDWTDGDLVELNSLITIARPANR